MFDFFSGTLAIWVSFRNFTVRLSFRNFSCL